MVKSKASTVEEYLAELPDDRREIIAEVRKMILEHLPAGYQESVNWGMITYEIPLERYPNTYNGQPLGYVALAAQKNHYALYLLGVYGDSEQEAALRKAYAEAGKRLDMGKSCLRFRKLEDLLMEPVAQIVASTPPDAMIALYEASRRR
ncbi:MAG: DUF1801 domain-containing protein [Anaerolineae bacterium]|jgi:uncharacterized protein YdhG (YjbR/CyaY superfamily)|nr:DUF1801 domain-containing protein [Anaerolineae bacterium]